MTAFVAYYRVSTAKQGRSGLGLEAQRDAVWRFLGGEPAPGTPANRDVDGAPFIGTSPPRHVAPPPAVSIGSHHLLAEYTETESGKNNARPKLADAMRHAKAKGATLIIAKLDRLARNMAFIANLMDGGIDFVACDLPSANRFTLHVMAALAEQEAAMISQRTKAALAAAKRRGKKLGGDRGNLPSVCARGTRASVKARKAAAQARALHLAPVVEELRGEGVTTLQSIADALNQRNHAAPRGGLWGPSQVHALIRRRG
jgi:DNA invertase Pin-like site-specific DNA recombinase